MGFDSHHSELVKPDHHQAATSNLAEFDDKRLESLINKCEKTFSSKESFWGSLWAKANISLEDFGMSDPPRKLYISVEDINAADPIEKQELAKELGFPQSDNIIGWSRAAHQCDALKIESERRTDEKNYPEETKKIVEELNQEVGDKLAESIVNGQKSPVRILQLGLAGFDHAQYAKTHHQKDDMTEWAYEKFKTVPYGYALQPKLNDRQQAIFDSLKKRSDIKVALTPVEGPYAENGKYYSSATTYWITAEPSKWREFEF